MLGISAGQVYGVENVIERALTSRYSVTGLVYDEPNEGHPLPGAAVVRGDARSLPFADGAFDYVVSNAVIEHVGGRDGARALLEESRRVARVATFHTTPDRMFPVETHTLVPLLHWLPRRWQEAVFERVGKEFPTERYWLFTRRELRGLTGGHLVERLTSMTLVTSWWRDGVSAAERIDRADPGMGVHAARSADLIDLDGRRPEIAPAASVDGRHPAHRR